MAEEPKDKEPEPVHPHDAIDPREFILTTPLGEDRLADLKRLMPEGAERGEFWLPYCSEPGSYNAGFEEQANYEFFQKKYPWLHRKNASIGLDPDEINPYVPAFQQKPDYEPQFASFEEFLITISSDDWTSFVEDVESLENYPSMDDERAGELRQEEERKHWEDYAFEDWLKEALKKFRDDSFHQWAILSLGPWDAYELCTNAGHYMEDEGGGSVYMRVGKAVEDIEWNMIEAEIDEPALRRSYDEAKLACWRGDGGEQFLAACKRHATTDEAFSNGLATLDDARLKSIYDSVVLDQNIASDDMPGYLAIAGEEAVEAAEAVGPNPAREARAAVPPSLVVTLGLEDKYEKEAADAAVVLARDMIAKGFGTLPPPAEHPELPFPRHDYANESVDPKDFILKQPPQEQALVKVQCPLCEGWSLIAWRFISNDESTMTCRVCGRTFQLADSKKVFEGKQAFGRQTSAADKWIPKGFKIDDEFGCQTAAETLAKRVPKLRMVVGRTRLQSERQWGDHKWCVTPDGTIVDPYFRWRFPDEWRDIVYKEDPTAFDGSYLDEAEEIPDPYDPDRLTQADVHNWIVSGGPDVGELLWNTDRLYLIIPGDQHTLDKYLSGQKLGNYFTTIVGVPDPHGLEDRAFGLREEYGVLISTHRADVNAHLDDPNYGPDLRQALITRYKAMAREARQNSEEDFRNALLMLFQVGGYQSLKGFYRHLRPGQMYRFDLKYGMALLKRGRLAAAAKRFGVNRQQVSRDGYFYAVPDWNDTTELFGEDRNHDFKKGAETIFGGNGYEWTEGVEGDTSEAIDMLKPEDYKEIRERLLWAEVNNPNEDTTMVLQPNVLKGMSDADIKEMLKDADEYGGRVEEVVERLTAAHRRASETAQQDAYYTSYIDALVDVLGPYKFQKIGGKEMLTFLIPWADMFERLSKAQEDQGEDYDGSLDDLVENYSEKAMPRDDPSPDYKAIPALYHDYLNDELYELKPLPPQELPEPPGQLPLLPESLQMLMEGYKWGCTMVNLPPKQAEFLLQWGKLNIPDDFLHDPPDDDTMGRKDEMHTTVKYGLQTKGVPEVLRKLVAETAAFPVYMGAVSMFRQDEYDVIKLGVSSPWLTALHNKIGESIPCPGDKWPTYKPHVTLAYVRPGSCDHLVGQDPFNAEGSPGAEFVAYEIEYTGPGELDGDRVKEKMPLNKTDMRPPEVKEAVNPREFIFANAPHSYRIVMTSDADVDWYFIHHGAWTVARSAGAVMGGAEALTVLADERDTAYGFPDSDNPRFNIKWKNLRLEPVEALKEAVNPREFIMGQSPRYIVGDEGGDAYICQSGSGNTFVWSIGRNARWEAHVWKNLAAAERYASHLNEKPRYGLRARVIPLISESVDAREFIMTQPLGYSVRLSLPTEDRPFYYRSTGAASREAGPPMALEVAERLVAYMKEKYATQVDSYIEIEPVYESATAIRNVIPGASQRNGSIQEARQEARIGGGQPS